GTGAVHQGGRQPGAGAGGAGGEGAVTSTIGARTIGAKVAIEVACALPDRQLVVALEVPSGTTALEAVALAGIAEAFPEVPIDPARIGVHGRLLGTRGLAPAALYA